MELLRREAMQDTDEQNTSGPRARLAAIIATEQPVSDAQEPQRPKLDPNTWGMDSGEVDWTAVAASQPSV